MRLSRCCSIVLAVLFFAYVGTYAQTEKPLKAPNFSLKTADGKTLELGKMKSKLIVVNFWATWCRPCTAEMPGLSEVYQNYKSRGLEIVGVSLDVKGWAVVKPFLQRTKVPYPIVLGDQSIVDDYGGIQAIPTTFFIDQDGNIVKKHIGYLSKDEFEKQVKTFL